jgi:hypothetical protein
MDVGSGQMFEDPFPDVFAALAVADGQPDRGSESGEAVRRR